MANYRKSFNLRNGVQVDNDNFIVNTNGLVGIGTSVPTENLDVLGTVKVSGLTTTNTFYTGIATVGFLTARNGAYITGGASVSGILTATSFYGDASGLTGIYAIAVDGWYIDTPGSSISTTFKVGIGTTTPSFSLQIGDPIFSNGTYFDASTGNVYTTGILTALSFSGSLNASNLTGTINNSLLPSTITASSFVGNLTGIASTANSITNSADIQINSINSGFSTTGIATIFNKLNVVGNIGVGTENPNSQLHVRKSGISSIQLTSDGSNSSTITFGRSVNITSTSNNGQIRFGNTSGSYPDSNQQSVDIINFDTGNLNFYLNPGGSGTGSFNWFKSGISKIMTLESSGNLGINSTSPTSKLSVVGNADISGVLTATTISSNSLKDKDGEVGSPNQILTSTGSQIDWKNLTDLPLSGRVLQILRQTYSVQTAHGPSWTPTGLTTSITPSSITSKVIILVNQPVTNNGDTSGSIRISKNAGFGTEALYNPGQYCFGSGTSSGNVWTADIASLQYIDTPGTTGIVTYYTEGYGSAANAFDSNSGSFGLTNQSATSQIYLIEIS